MGNDSTIKKKKEGSNFIVPPDFWRKCPKCKELNYRKELGKTNKCYYCGYLFPYPVEKLAKNDCKS
jgi:acetyl-CoA carboxylase beta subunit